MSQSKQLNLIILTMRQRLAIAFLVLSLYLLTGTHLGLFLHIMLKWRTGTELPNINCIAGKEH